MANKDPVDANAIVKTDEEKEAADILAYQTPSEILPYLFCGAYRHASMEEVLLQQGIHYILNVKDSCRYPTSASLTLEHVPLSDYGDTKLLSSEEDDDTTLKQCFSFIEKAKANNSKILVHCSQGVNRAPTVVIAYLIAVENWTLKKAYEHVVKQRPVASPHEKYFTQLQALDESVHGEAPSLTRKDIGPSLQDTLRNIRHERTRGLDETSVDRASTATNFSVSTFGTAKEPATAVPTFISAQSDIDAQSSTASHHQSSSTGRPSATAGANKKCILS